MAAAVVDNTTHFAVPLGNLESYIHALHQLPVLDATKERELAERLRDCSDLDAARTLVLHNLRFVIYIARGYTGYGLALGDLIQEGSVGLMKAVKRFDPALNVRLISFAVHWIRAEIHEFILRNWRIVKIATTKAQRKLFFNLRSSKQRLGWFRQNEIAQVAADLGVSEAQVMEMESRLAGQDVSFDPDPEQEDGHNPSPAQLLTDERADPALVLEESEWEQYQHTRLQQALENLDERSRDILAKRWLGDQKATLHELAAQYNVSAERIRQLENNAMRKLKVSVEGAH